MWETGKRNPEFETLEALLSLLNVSYDYLTGKSKETAHNTLITDEKKKLSAWTVEDELYDTFRKFLALDPYGINAATQVIMSEYQRCSCLLYTSSSDTAVRVEFFGDEIDRISEIDVLTGEIKCQLAHIGIFPASHYVVPAEQIQKAAIAIEEELKERVDYFKSEDKLLEAQRISCLLYTSSPALPAGRLPHASSNLRRASFASSFRLVGT